MLSRARVHLQKMTQSQKTLSEMKMPSPLLKPPSGTRIGDMMEYLQQHTFDVGILFTDAAAEHALDALDAHPSMPEGYCVQNIVRCDPDSDDESVFYVQAYIAPKAWHGSKERKNKNGELAELMPGIPIQKNALVEKRYKIVDEFKFPTILYQDRPLITGEDEERLKQWMEEGKKLVAVCHPLANRVQVYQDVDDTSVFDDIVTALCIPVSPTQLCYFGTVMMARINFQHRRLTKVLHDTCDALHEKKPFSFQILFRLLISELVLSKKTTLSPMLESRDCDGNIYQVVEIHGRREELQQYVDRFFLFVHAKELLFELLTGCNMTEFCKEKLYEFIQEIAREKN